MANSVRMCVGVVSAAAAMFAACGLARADRADVERVMKGMQESVLSADQTRYMSFVATDDALFLQEQKMWAADLGRHVPIAFTLAIAEHKDGDDKAAPVFETEHASVEMVMSWTMAGMDHDGTNLTRTISFPVEFGKDADGVWKYRGEKWLTLETPDKLAAEGESKGAAETLPVHQRARAKFYAGYEAPAKVIVDVMPEVREHVHEGFELKVPRVEEVKIYPTMKHLQASIYLSYVDGLSGWNEPGEAIKLVVSPKAGASRLKPLLAHEYGHVATFELGPKSNEMAWWILEGVAELSAEKYGRSTEFVKDAVIGWHNKGTLAEWKDLADFRTVPDSLGGHVYHQGHHMIGYISDRFGRTKRNAWMRGMSGGKTMDEATIAALGLSFEQLDKDWRESVRELAEQKAAKKVEADAPRRREDKPKESE